MNMSPTVLASSEVSALNLLLDVLLDPNKFRQRCQELQKLLDEIAIREKRLAAEISDLERRKAAFERKLKAIVAEPSAN